MEIPVEEIFFNMENFKKEFLKFFSLCFSQPTLIFTSTLKDCFSINGMIFFVDYDTKYCEINLWIANFEAMSLKQASLFLEGNKINKKTMVEKIYLFKNNIIDDKLINESYRDNK